MILDPKNKPVLSAEEAFKLLGIDRGTGYNAIRNDSFPVPIIRVGRIIRIPTAALCELLQAKTVIQEHSKQKQADEQPTSGEGKVILQFLQITTH